MSEEITPQQSPQAAPRPKRNPKLPRQDPRLLNLEDRTSTPKEVSLGFNLEQALIEARRCLNCKNATCIDACPIRTDIRGFIGKLYEGDLEGAYQLILQTNPFPGICGRVCQHELYCEKDCLLGKKLQPVAIGSLERFVADHHRDHGPVTPLEATPWNGMKVALVGSGPASIVAAHDLARMGYKVAMFEALHELGGVLSYGIPPFRLPRDIIHEEVDRLQELGVTFHTDFIVGKTCKLEELFAQGYDAAFIGTGAGLPYLLNIPGENLIGVYTANEFLTRINLMRANQFPSADTPVRTGARTVVIGGGNSAMDAARWSRRLGSETTILFRRGHAELRARMEEIEHAEEEGIHFEFLGAPVRIIGNERGVVSAIECLRMELGEVDSSGRPSPVPIPGSEYIMPVDIVVAAIGQRPNPTLQQTCPQLVTQRGKITIDTSGLTSLPNVYAGGDVVRGGSTVIMALRDGRVAAKAIDDALRGGDRKAFPIQVEAPKAPLERPRFRIEAKRMLTPEIALLEVYAPLIASHWKPGQFVILRPTPESERIPLTLVDGDVDKGTITLIVQAIGKTTKITAALEVGDELADLLGPLGKAAEVENHGTAVCIGGGVGVAELLPVVRAFKAAGNHTVALCGARSQAHMILDEELKASADEVHWATDDGSAGFHGNVVQLMKHWKAAQSNGSGAGVAHVIGPIVMMKFASELTREWGVKTMASLNPIMVDGTGMCGGCRVTVGGKVYFACVDGPEFDAHEVDFAELQARTRAYVDEEKKVLEEHICRIGLGQ